jgi:hypothetical protein
MKIFVYLSLYYPFINHVIEFSMEWSLKLYSVNKIQIFFLSNRNIFLKGKIYVCIHD